MPENTFWRHSLYENENRFVSAGVRTEDLPMRGHAGISRTIEVYLSPPLSMQSGKTNKEFIWSKTGEMHLPVSANVFNSAGTLWAK
jgi:hypothetical protein